MRWVQKLVSQGVATPEQVVEALDRQRRTRVPLGRIARGIHMLTARQLCTVLARQSDEPSLRLGEIAVQLGYLSQSEVSYLLGLQQERMSSLEAELIGLGVPLRQAA